MPVNGSQEVRLMTWSKAYQTLQPPPERYWPELHRLSLPQKSTVSLMQNVVRSGEVMDINERQIALSVLESLRADLMYAHLKSGGRILDVADLRQYIYEMMSGIRTNALEMSDLYGKHNGHGQDFSKE